MPPELSHSQPKAKGFCHTQLEISSSPCLNANWLYMNILYINYFVIFLYNAIANF